MHGTPARRCWVHRCNSSTVKWLVACGKYENIIQYSVCTFLFLLLVLPPMAHASCCPVGWRLHSTRLMDHSPLLLFHFIFIFIYFCKFNFQFLVFQDLSGQQLLIHWWNDHWNSGKHLVSSKQLLLGPIPYRCNPSTTWATVREIRRWRREATMSWWFD